MIRKAVCGEELPLYGDGNQRREWLHVDDHCRALVDMLTRGRVGETYLVGSGEELSNRDFNALVMKSVASGRS